MKRLLIYFFYDKDGIVDDYIPYVLKAFRPFCSEVCMVVNGNITEESKLKVQPLIDNMLIRENVGLDAEAYKYAIKHYGYEALKAYDELVCTNFTYFGPFSSMTEFWDTMDSKECDWWGVYRWPIANPIYHHIPSFFVGYRNSLLKDKAFEQYWETMKEIKTYADSCRFHEQRQTPYYDSLGFKNAVYFENHFKYMEDWNLHWPLKDADRLLKEDNFPFVKRRNFFWEEYTSRYKSTLDNIVSYIKNDTDYDFSMISKNILRTENYDIIKRYEKNKNKYKLYSKFHFKKLKRHEYRNRIQLLEKMKQYENLLKGSENV